MFKDRAQEREAERQRAAAARAEMEETSRRNRWLMSPEGRATTAKEKGLPFFEIQLEVAASQRSVAFGTADFGEQSTPRDHLDTLAAVEAVGWRLEHVGYVFVITGETSRDKLLSSGQNTAVSGQTVGIYLFRNVG